MPTYDYYCPAADRVVEAFHSISKQVSTWGELCECAGIEPGEIPLDAPVERQIPSAAPFVSSSTPSRRPSAPQRGGGGCCGGGGCGCH
ncbi:MAG TPA: zinc ribbon domain-containing protein [Planctomycetota bacterium]|nr:zinc ribbon domain-containing protein [Planctomycetota bacterium]